LECAVIGTPDDNRGAIVQAHIVLTEDSTESNELKIELQDYVKAKIAPFKYPRSIVFKNSLPKTQTGKIQRFLLRNQQNMEIKNVS